MSARQTMEEFCSQSLEKRQALSAKIKTTCPNSLPVLLNTIGLGSLVAADHNWKFIFRDSYRLSQVYCEIIRTGLKISLNEGIYFYIHDRQMNGVIPALSSTLSELYNKYANIDGFLYLYVAKESVFG